MPVTVKIENDESIDLALRKLSKKVKNEMDRRWYKRRFGYYEKPSTLKRKSEKMKKLTIQSGGALWLKIGLKEQFSKNGGSAAGRWSCNWLLTTGSNRSLRSLGRAKARPLTKR